MIGPILNIFFSTVMAVAGTYLLGAYGYRFNWLERGGIAVQAGAAVIRIGTVMSRYDLFRVKESPFDNWSGPLFVFGGAMALIGIIMRLEGYAPGQQLLTKSGEGLIGRWRHARRNAAANRQAERWLQERGKVRE